MNSKISIIIPVYNRRDDLKKTLDSIKQQTFKSFEIIVVDDCSTDGSTLLAKKHADKIIINRKNSGPAISRNNGIKVATAELLVFIDSDCVADKYWLENIFYEYKNNSEQVIMGGVIIPKSTFVGDCISALGFPAGGHIGFEKMWHVSKDGHTDHITSCNFAISRKILDEQGYFDNNFKFSCEDAEFSYRLAKNDVKIKYAKDAVVYHKPKTSILSFLKDQITRGQGNYFFKKKIDNVGSFIKLRIWSSKNILIHYSFSPKIFLIVPLLLLSFFLQQYGFFYEKQYKKIRKYKDKFTRTLTKIKTLADLGFLKPKNFLIALGFLGSPDNILAYWSICAKNKNFGDIITPYILKKMTKKTPFLCSKFCRKEYYIVTGSIIGRARKNAIIWGAGILNKYQKIHKHKKILAVRGPLTRKRILEQGFDCPEIYGDPALLLPRFYKPIIDKQYDLGIIPHYLDHESVREKIKEKNILIINLLDPIKKVIDDINRCKRTISSSLHGIIASHAYNIPSMWVEFSDKLPGDNIKFEDYFLSVKIKPYSPLKINIENFQSKKIIFLIDKKYSQKIQINLDKLIKTCPFWSNETKN